MKEFRGIQYDFNILNPDHAEAWENADEKVLNAGKEITKHLNEGGKYSVGVRKYCETMVEVIDSIVGEGTCKKIFNGTVSVDGLAKAYSDLGKDIEADMKSKSKEALKSIER